MFNAFEITEMFLGQHPKSQPITFTLTRRNMPFRDFHNAVEGMLRAFDLLAQLRLFFALGTFRHLEVTRDDGAYHPHLHCLMVVPPWYFSQSTKVYLHPRELSAMWGVALGVDYVPVTNMRSVRGIGNLAAWFRYLEHKPPVHLSDIPISEFGRGLAELERRLMSQEEEGIAYGDRLPRHQTAHLEHRS